MDKSAHHVRALATVLICTASSSFAACGTGLETFLSCDIGRSGKVLNVCFDQEVVTYSFGRPGTPDLALVENIADIDYTPWPGAGSTIWEEVRFTNGDYSYVTHAGFNRMFDDTTEEIHTSETFGGVVVMRGDDVIADLSCVAGTVDAPWGEGLFQAKRAAGLTWDYTAREWRKTRQ